MGWEQQPVWSLWGTQTPAASGKELELTGKGEQPLDLSTPPVHLNEQLVVK